MSDNRFSTAVTVSELLGQLAGAASMCWENVRAAGVFQSDQALEYVEEAEERLREILCDEETQP